MLPLQPDKDNIFRRIWNDLRADDLSQGSEEWIEFEACKLTIQSIVQTLFTTKASKLQQDDLSDYEEALMDIRICYHNFSVSDLGTQYAFSNIIGPLEKATIYVNGASGIKNYHSITRTRYIQELRKFLVETLDQIEGLGGIPP
jgi:hypothetical protein